MMNHYTSKCLSVLKVNLEWDQKLLLVNLLLRWINPSQYRKKSRDYPKEKYIWWTKERLPNLVTHWLKITIKSNPIISNFQLMSSSYHQLRLTWPKSSDTISNNKSKKLHRKLNNRKNLYNKINLNKNQTTLPIKSFLNPKTIKQARSSSYLHQKNPPKKYKNYLNKASFARSTTPNSPGGDWWSQASQST